MQRGNHIHSTLALLILLVIAGGCQPNTDPAPDDTAYFPLQTGDYWIYQVTQENYSLTGGATTTAYQVQEKIGSSFTRSGQVFFQVEESTRTSEKGNWQINAIRTVFKSLSEVVSQENNVPTRSLVFPISTNTSWNSNTYNALPDSLPLRYENISRPFAVNKLAFDHAVSVVGPSDSTLIGLTKYQRVYALSVGLVYRENTALAYCQSTPDCIGKGVIASGSRQKWALLSSNRLP
ncbi:hypothetical protein [Spirosoma pollinicola]|uniref:Uncharacterized protein n=1 Tax=Spirosoma pollinicola TaxID=2057025 RepID=A0A2K8YXX2_9BACT|nr:hypothetical protein [Spirosoma pollinicola]AUD02486.1 hypothetical protein CWM47_12005 [Spirosoma pollinicola]